MKNIPYPTEDCNAISTAPKQNNTAFTASVPDGDIPGSSGEDSGKRHSFSKKLAREIQAKKKRRHSDAGHAAHETTILKYLANRVRRSKHVKRGKHWFYITIEELAKVFPYLGNTTCYDLVIRLRDLDYVEIDNFNQWRRDKTFWYHVPKEICASVENDIVYFDSAVAANTNVPAAVLFGNFEHWIGEYEKKGLPLQVQMSPVILSKLLPFSESTIKRGLKSLESKYLTKVSENIPLYGLFQANNKAKVDEIGSDPNSFRSDPNDRGSDPNSFRSHPNSNGSDPNDITCCKPISKLLKSSSKGEPAALPFEINPCVGIDHNDIVDSHAASITTDTGGQKREAMDADDTNDDDKISSPFSDALLATDHGIIQPSSDSSHHGMATNADEHDGEHMEMDKITSPRSAFFSSEGEHDVPSTNDISGVADDVDGGWPHVETLEDLHERILGYVEYTDAHLGEHEARDEFRTTVHHICQRTMARVDVALADDWFEDPDGEMILRGLLPHFHEAMRETDMDPLDFQFDLLYYNALECLVGSFLWPRQCGQTRQHPVLFLTHETYELYLKLWLRDHERREASVARHFAALKVANASRDEDKERDAELSPAEKTRFFRNGLNARNKTGWLFYDQTHRVDQIKHIGPKALNLMQRLFGLDPELTAADLLGVMDRCMMAFAGQPKPETKAQLKKGKPPYGVKWHARMGHDLIFFVTNLHWIVDELGVPNACRVQVFLKDSKEGLGADEEQPPSVEPVISPTPPSEGTESPSDDKWEWAGATEMDDYERRQASKRCLAQVTTASTFFATVT